jgi:hypothetical protein
MRYLVLDGYISGTGIRDAISDEYLELKSLPLPKELIDAISSWKNEYYKEVVSGKSSTEKEKSFQKLDGLGVELSKALKVVSNEIKVDYYYSDFKSKRVYLT